MDLLHMGRHAGGVIAPGLEMRLSAMSKGTANLPQIEMNDLSPALCQVNALGLNTRRHCSQGLLVDGGRD